MQIIPVSDTNQHFIHVENLEELRELRIALWSRYTSHYSISSRMYEQIRDAHEKAKKASRNR